MHIRQTGLLREFPRWSHRSCRATATEEVLVHELLTGRCEHEEMNEEKQSGFPSLVSVIAACGFVLLAALTAPLWLGPAQNWLGPLKNWLPRVSSPEQAGTQVPQASGAAWSDEEIKTALMHCVQAVAPLNADVAPLSPLRSGECGTPAPVLVKSIGDKDKVLFDPPLTLDCAMVVGLDRWLRESVQPAARETLSSTVSKIIGSSYACRNVYNLTDGNLSQHAFANAVDLPMFVLADGRKIDVTHGWGPTQRDLIAIAKAKKAAADVTDAGQQKTDKNIKGGTSNVVQVSASPALTSTNPAGPSAAPSVDTEATAEAEFLRLAHGGGCKVFSTVLGPEANDVHRTHFHLDLQDRKVTVCK